MRRRATLLVLAAVLVSGGCERTTGVLTSSPEPKSMRLAVPDLNYRLTPEQRSHLPRGFDVAALERLVGMIEPDIRAEILASFLPDPKRAASDEWESLVRFDDPVLQAALDEVWAPYWDRYTDEEIEREVAYLPGRDLVRKRRAALRAQRRGETAP